jgi:hypothetical protein
MTDDALPGKATRVVEIWSKAVYRRNAGRNTAAARYPLASGGCSLSRTSRVVAAMVADTWLTPFFGPWYDFIAGCPS